MTITYQQIADHNPYQESIQLEESLNRNQRDILDFFMMCGDNQDPNIYDLISYMKYIKMVYGIFHPQPTEDDCLEIYRMYQDYMSN
jgi:hypothetical protein